jgi:PAS domain S-box-containing protein
MDHALSRVVDALPGLVWIAHQNGDATFFNHRWSEYTGLSAGHSREQQWQAAIHPDDLPQLLEHFRRIGASGRPGEMEVRVFQANQGWNWFPLRTYPLDDTSGQVVNWCSLGTDIEDHRRSENVAAAHWWLSRIGRESYFRSWADRIPAIACLMTPSGQMALVNRQCLEYHGLTLDELIGAPRTDLIDRDDLPHVLAISHKTDEQPYDYEARIRRADGSYRWFHTTVFPLRDTEDRIVLWYVLTIDVDDRRRAESLLAGEKRFLEMVARGHSMVAILEALCRLVESTAAGCSCSVMLTDASGMRLEHGAAPSLPASFICANIDAAVDPYAGPCARAVSLGQQVIASDLTDPQWAAYTWWAVAVAHGLRACWSTPILSAAGKALGAIAIYHNEPKTPTPLQQSLIEQFTHMASIAVERAQSDAALQRSEAFLAEAQRLSATGSFHWRVATDEITWSDQLYRIFELDPRTKVTLERIASQLHPEDVAVMRDILERMRQDETDFEYDFRQQTPGGTTKHLHMVAHATRDRNGHTEYIGAIQDVTQRRVSEEALGKARSELAHVARVSTLGVLTASIAHEVNQPLSGIITNTGTCRRCLAADPPDLEGARETIRRTIRDANRAAEVIARLRALFSKKEFALEPIDLNEAAREVIALLLGEFQRNRVIVRSVFADDLPLITGDRIQLQQVILNLLRNASDAMAGVEGGPRRLLSRKPGIVCA